MKRLICAILAILLAIPAMAMAQSERVTIVTTIFPAYDFARQIAGDDADVTMLLPPGGESHSYEPTPQDMIAIQKASLFVCNGGESESWLENVLDSMGDNAPTTFRMTDQVTELSEELSDSMQAEEEAGEEQGDEVEMDEHVWTSPQNAILIVQALCDTLCEQDPAHAEGYRARTEAYTQQLQALDESFHQAVETGKRKLIVVGDRFPLRYFAAEMGLSFDAAFPGCSEDAEPSAQTVVSLVRKVKEEGVPVVFYIEGSSGKTAKIIAEETGAKALLFHSCHNIGSDELAAGETYLSLMTRNVEALKEALN